MTVARALSSTHPYDWMDDVIYILDANGYLIFANICTLRQWGKQLHDVVGRPLEEVLPYTPAKELQNAFKHALSAQQRTEFDTFGMRERGWLNITLHPHEGGLIVHIRPLARTSGINIPAQLDALTGCLTRAALQTALNVINEPQVLAIVDLNRLKSVNTLMDVNADSTPAQVWLLRDFLEQAVSDLGGTPLAFTVLTEDARASSERWFGPRHIPPTPARKEQDHSQ